jgi:hypothetical protein
LTSLAAFSVSTIDMARLLVLAGEGRDFSHPDTKKL